MFKIIALVKHTPDLTSDRRYAADLTVDRDAVDCHLSELDEYAAEQAIALSESLGDCEITYLTVGPEDADATVRKALSMGGDRGVHVLDPALHGSDAWGTARVLASAISQLECDLVLCGMSSTDGAMGVVPAMVAEALGIPQVTYADELSCDGSTVEVRRESDVGSAIVTAQLIRIERVRVHCVAPRNPCSLPR